MRKLLWLTVGVALCVVSASSIWSASRKPATVRLTADNVKLEITFQDGRKLIVTSKGTKLSSGTHFVKSLRLFKKDARNRTWELRSTKQLSTLKTITLAPGQEKILDTGKKPIHFDYFIWPRKKGGVLRVLFRFTARGGYGEVYYPGAILGRKVPPMPAYRITDENGKVLASGRLKHQPTDVGIYDWIVPGGVTGNCKIEIKPTMGPFEWGPASKQFKPEPRN